MLLSVVLLLMLPLVLLLLLLLLPKGANEAENANYYGTLVNN